WFANLRGYYGFMWTYPGKKLLFMGCEFAQERAWEHDGQLEWHCLDEDGLARRPHGGVHELLEDLQHLHAQHAALHRSDVDSRGFQWIVCEDAVNSVFAYCRYAVAHDAPPLLIAINFTPVPRPGYRLGVPRGGFWRERINTDATLYGGSNVGNNG